MMQNLKPVKRQPGLMRITCDDSDKSADQTKVRYDESHVPLFEFCFVLGFSVFSTLPLKQPRSNSFEHMLSPNITTPSNQYQQTSFTHPIPVLPAQTKIIVKAAAKPAHAHQSRQEGWRLHPAAIP